MNFPMNKVQMCDLCGEFYIYYSSPSIEYESFESKDLCYPCFTLTQMSDKELDDKYYFYKEQKRIAEYQMCLIMEIQAKRNKK